MKISLNWLTKYIKVGDTASKISKRLTNSGIEIINRSEFTFINTDLVIGQVIKVEDHPDAYRLKIAKVDLSNQHYLSIVCGAPNLYEGQRVVVARPGTKLMVDGKKFIIKETKIRGVLSEGMLCSEQEIGISNNSDGIMEIPSDAEVGDYLYTYLDTKPDTVLEAEVTPNRGDALSYIGIARELAAIYAMPMDIPKVITPEVHDGDINLPIGLAYITKSACLKYATLSIEGIKVKESPIWLKNRLLSIGVEPINNVVDITNFVMYELGQPLHAFDYDKIEFPMYIGFADTKTEIIGVHNKEIKIVEDDIVVGDTESPLALAGVIGGMRAAITAKTTNILLESACYPPKLITKASKFHNISTEASYRFSRGVDPNITLYALRRAADLITLVCGGKVSSKIINFYTDMFLPKKIKVSYIELDRVAGIKMERDTVNDIVERLGMEIVESTEEDFYVKVPTYKVNITREIEVIEEIIKIYGYKKLFMSANESIAIDQPYDKINEFETKIDITNLLINNGYYEIRTKSLTNSEHNEYIDNNHITVLNPTSILQNSLKNNLVIEGLNTIEYNINREQKSLKLFEFGKVYINRENKEYLEKELLGIWITAPKNSGHVYNIYDIKNIVYHILSKVGINDNDIDQSTQEHDKVLEQKLLLTKNNYETQLATVGKVTDDIIAKFNINQDVFFAEIDIDNVINNKQDNIEYVPIPKFPYVKRDLSIIIDTNITFETIRRTLINKFNTKIEKIKVIDTYYNSDKDANKKTYTLRLLIKPKNKTLTSQDIDKLMDKIIITCEDSLNATINK